MLRQLTNGNCRQFQTHTTRIACFDLLRFMPDQAPYQGHPSRGITQGFKLGDHARKHQLVSFQALRQQA